MQGFGTAGLGGLEDVISQRGRRALFEILAIAIHCLARQFPAPLRRHPPAPPSRRLPCPSLLIAAAILAAANSVSHAQVQRSFINTSFEEPVLPGASCWSIRESQLVPGWETTEPTWNGPWNFSTHGLCGGHKASTPVEGPIQMFRNFDAGIAAPDGEQWAELNAYSGRRLYQEVCMVSGEQVQWSLFHRGRLNTDLFRFNIGTNPSGAGATTIFDARTTTAGTGIIDATGLGTVNVESQADGTTWARYSGSFTWNQNGETTIGFQSREGGSSGNILDDIDVRLTPYIEFQPGSSSGAEEIATANIPGIRLTGTLDNPVNVQVTITGGTATLGTDYTTPSGTNAFIVTVPAGEYDGTQPISLGLSIVDDTGVESDETIEMRIEEDPANYTISGTQACGAVPNVSSTYTILDNETGLSLVKESAFEDVDGDGATNPGDRITYTFTVTNTGSLTLQDVSPVDPGPRFNGVPGENALSAFDPPTATLAAGEQQVFTATYTLGQGDANAAAGVDDGIQNTAIARGFANGNSTTGTAVDSAQSVTVLGLPADFTVTKVALLRIVRRGEEVPFLITVTNNANPPANGLTVEEMVPPGFRFVEGSATIDGNPATPTVSGNTVSFENLSVPGNSQLEIGLRLLVLSSAEPGEHENAVRVIEPPDTPVTPVVTAPFLVLADPVFDCGDVIGKVFDDENRNGYQDRGEPGLPGVRLASVKGELITTDEHGRFSVPCAMLPDQRIGSNFILKLDPRTLPSGYRITTENPRVVRLTAGKMTELNFGAAIGRVVRLDLQDGAFAPGDTALRPEWEQGIDRLIGLLRQEQSVLRLTYLGPETASRLARYRLAQTADLIRQRWRRLPGGYRLEIEMRVEAGR